MNVQPTALRMITEDCLEIVWSDDQVRQYQVSQLRAECLRRRCP